MFYQDIIPHLFQLFTSSTHNKDCIKHWPSGHGHREGFGATVKGKPWAKVCFFPSHIAYKLVQKIYLCMLPPHVIQNIWSLSLDNGFTFFVKCLITSFLSHKFGATVGATIIAFCSDPVGSNSSVAIMLGRSH